MRGVHVMSEGKETKGKLSRSLKNRHLQMIALGSCIGTGLFYGSAATIKLAGPAIILSYLIGGIFIFLFMRMLGEMTAYEPVGGGYVAYANKYLGPFAAYLLGWSYWLIYLLLSMAEVAACAVYISFWWPGIPVWLSSLFCIALISCLNLFKVKVYGESEFISAFIKIAAIIAMIVFGFIIIFTQMGDFPNNFHNLWDNGGFLPNGMWGLLQSLVVVIFAFAGIELVAVASGETENPEKSIPTAINQIVLRILIFYIGTMLVLMTLSPWNQVGLTASPFVQIFENIGIPAAAHILNFVVLIAALSVYNSVMYSNPRFLYGLAKGGNAPKCFSKISNNGIPVIGTIFTSLLTLAIVLLSIVYPSAGDLFMKILSYFVVGILLCWATIIITHIKFRKTMAAQDRLNELKFKSIGYPYVNYLSLLCLIGIVIIMWFTEDMHNVPVAIPIWLLILYVTYKIKHRNKKDDHSGFDMN